MPPPVSGVRELAFSHVRGDCDGRRDYFAYCGTYELRNGGVVHRVELSLMPNWIGGELVRLVAFDGERVTLSTPPTPVAGRQQIATLVWERT